TLTLPVLANALLHADDDDWWGLPLHEKPTYLHLKKHEDGSYCRVPWGIGFGKALLADPILTFWMAAHDQAPELTARNGPVRDWLHEVTGVDRVWINAMAEVGDRFLEQSPTAFFYQPAKTAANKNVFVGALQLGLPTILDPAL